MQPPAAAVFVALCAIGEWPVFFTLELKHYSADMFGSLLVPALAARAVEGAEDDDADRHLRQWWIAAAIVQWFSNGALFVTPLCAAVLVAAVARSRGRRALGAMLPGAGVWLVSFALNYVLILRHAAANQYLQHYWAFAFPPLADGVTATVGWIAAQIRAFAIKPGSSGLPLLFWVTWLAGIVYGIAARRTHALFVATVPLSALALALVHVVPPFERLAMWVVPSTYAGIAYAVDAASAGVALARSRPLIAAASAVALLFALAVPADITQRGVNALRHRPQSNYGLDDRRSISWLLATHRRGDAVMTTHFGLAALWWYGKIAVNGAGRGTTLPDGSPVYEIGYVPPDQDCVGTRRRANAMLAGRQRAAVYLGFRMNVEPVGFDDLALHELGARGALDTYKQYAEESRVAIFDLGSARSKPELVPGRGEPTLLPGCVEVRAAARW
jgi:hypothetical protein